MNHSDRRYTPRRLKTAQPPTGRKKTGWGQHLGRLSLLFYPLFCLITVEYFNYKAILTGLGQTVRHRFVTQLVEFTPQCIFSLLIVYLLFGVLWALVRRGWIATGIMGLASLLCGFINYMKIMLNGDPFVPMDFSLAGQTKELASFVSLSIPWLFWPALIGMALWTAILYRAQVTFPGKWWIGAPTAVVVSLAVGLVMGNSTYSGQVLSVFGMSLFDCSKQIDNYTCNGFTGGFTLNLMSLKVEKPQGYSQETVEELLSEREGVASDEDYLDYDVIVVLSESFFDLRELDGVSYSEDLLTNYDAIRASENCYSGTIYTTAIGGGTVRPEFHILTGLTTDVLPSGAVPYTYVNHDVESFVSNYRDAGYNTVALHLYDESFYSRNKGYPYLGFDRFLGLSEVQEELEVSFTRGYATDASTEAAIEYYLDQAGENGNPTFLFAITIENHQPYGENENNTVTVSADGLDDTALQALTTYAQGVKDADAMLGALREYVDSRERPTILVWYGDHKPTLGEVHTPYETLGYYDSQDTSSENRMTMYSTPFLVYANRTLEQGLFTSKSENRISDSYLLECVAVSSGFQQTPYMTLLGEMVEKLPIYNTRLNLDDSLTEEQTALAQAQKIITYDRLIGKEYSEE